MSRKKVSSVGLEYDPCGIRAARITSYTQKGEARNKVESVRELVGNYAEEGALVDGLKSILEGIESKPRDRVIVNASGRQVHVTQIKFRKLPPEEMKKALRAEIRKNLTFDAGGAALDYQIVGEGDAQKGTKPTVMVTAVANSLLDRQMKLLSKAGIKPWVVDVIPAAIANAYWIGRKEEEGAEGAHAMIHFGPEACTTVIDGKGAPFYSRSIYFGAEEIYGNSEKEIVEADRTKRLESLSDELRRSLSYYSKTYGVSKFESAYLIGNYAQNEDLRAAVRDKLGLKVEDVTLLKRLGYATPVPGKYDIVLALAMRGTEEP